MLLQLVIAVVLLSQLQPQAAVAQTVACLVVYLVVADVAMLLQLVIAVVLLSQLQPQAAVAQTAACLVV